MCGWHYEFDEVLCSFSVFGQLATMFFFVYQNLCNLNFISQLIMAK